jgi:YcaO-like protein with predicted kinase domain
MGTAKTWCRGTHRAVPPEATLARVRPLMAAMGITRIANVTGLDRLGVPVVTVCRPNGRSLAVAQGKGLTLDAAKASGLMESVEAWHAEHLRLPVTTASWLELAADGWALDPAALPAPRGSRWRRGHSIPWVAGRDLASGKTLFLPLEVVTLDCRVPLPRGFGCFQISTNGLASGNAPAEAVLHALSELIERDAVTLWRHGDPFHKAESRLDLESVDDPDARGLIDQLEGAGMALAVWDVTSDLGVPAFLCHLMEADLAAHDGLGWASGAGCHPDPGVALVRAVTEAAQARLTHIVGTRDDIGRRWYVHLEPERIRRHHAALTRAAGRRDFGALPRLATPSFEGDVDLLLDRLAGAGLDCCIAVDLTRPELAIPVFKLIVPGLEDGVDVPGWQPGARARAAMARDPEPVH